MSSAGASASPALTPRPAQTRLRAMLSRHPSVTVAGMLLGNAWWRIRLARGQRDTYMGATHAQLALDESIRYIETVFADYKRYGEIEHFTGNVAEIGPGDCAGVALLCRADGCEHVDLVDRYASYRDPARLARIYEALSRRHNLERFRAGSSWDDHVLAGIEWHVGCSAEEFFGGERAGQAYDYIISRCVLEYLQGDTLETFTAMARSLRPGGKMVHKIDLRDDGWFSSGGHELSWLSIPSSVYRHMVGYWSGPNRRLVCDYRQVIEALTRDGLATGRILVARLAGVGEVVPHRELEKLPPEMLAESTAYVEARRSGLSREFRGLDARDLAVTAIVLVLERCR